MGLIRVLKIMQGEIHGCREETVTWITPPSRP
jgi:hypothetical protein